MQATVITMCSLHNDFITVPGKLLPSYHTAYFWQITNEVPDAYVKFALNDIGLLTNGWLFTI